MSENNKQLDWTLLMTPEMARELGFIVQEDKSSPLQVGEVLYYSWGHDQTNIDYYLVTKVTAKKFWARKLAQSTREENGGMQGPTWPVSPKEFCQHGDEFLNAKSIRFYRGEFLASGRHGGIFRWDGNPKRCSWYA